MSEGQPLGSRPTALVLTGGASLGSWQGGVLYALEKEHGLRFHSVLGTSVGSLNAAAYFQDRTEDMKAMWRGLPRRSFMHFSPRLSPPSLFSHGALRRFLAPVIDEKVCLAERRCWFYAVSADLISRKMVQAEYSPEEGGPWDGPVLDHVMGSIAVPFLWPPVELAPRPGGRKQILVDGQLTSYADLARLVQRGARDFIFVSVVPKKPPEKRRLSARKFISSMIDGMLEAQVDNATATLRHMPPELGLRAFLFQPETPLGLSVFAFNPKECRAGFDRGVRDADGFIGHPRQFRIF